MQDFTWMISFNPWGSWSLRWPLNDPCLCIFMTLCSALPLNLGWPCDQLRPTEVMCVTSSPGLPEALQLLLSCSSYRTALTCRSTGWLHEDKKPAGEEAQLMVSTSCQTREWGQWRLSCSSQDIRWVQPHEWPQESPEELPNCEQPKLVTTRMARLIHGGFSHWALGWIVIQQRSI